MCKVSIRHAVPGDETILAEIQTKSWRSAFAQILSPQTLDACTNMKTIMPMYAHVLRQNVAKGWILFVDTVPHCMAFWGACREDATPDTAELICIHSLCGNWGKGYGSTMMQHILDEVKCAGYTTLNLWVFAENTRARKFYEKHGFELADKQRRNYDALEVMYTKQL